MKKNRLRTNRPRLSVSAFGIAFLIFYKSQLAIARNEFLEGHNLTSTTYTLRQGETTIGTYALGYGFTDHLMIATTPWLDLLYNMPTIEMKYGSALSENWRWSEEILYFRTMPYLMNIYQMNALMNRLGASYRFNDVVTLHSQFVSFYYYDDTEPFSLRLTPDNSERYELAVGFLLETHFNERWGSFMELGGLGLNYTNIYLHTGYSIFYQWSSGYIQIGLSNSFTNRNVVYLQNGTPSQAVPERESVYHPEFALQFFL